MQKPKKQRQIGSRQASENLTREQRVVIQKAVKKVVDEYGETLRMLGRE